MRLMLYPSKRTLIGSITTAAPLKVTSRGPRYSSRSGCLVKAKLPGGTHMLVSPHPSEFGINGLGSPVAGRIELERVGLRPLRQRFTGLGLHLGGSQSED